MIDLKKWIKMSLALEELVERGFSVQPVKGEGAVRVLDAMGLLVDVLPYTRIEKSGISHFARKDFDRILGYSKPTD